jgi:uncharacterized membrane protein SpoIIM required for sporulation
VDVDAFAAAHRGEWQRLTALVRRRDLSGAEVDELVGLYQRTATHLSTVRSASPDPALVGELSTLVARARSAVTGSHNPAWRDAARYLAVGLPAALYLSWRWSAGVAAGVLGVAWLIAAWVAGSHQVQVSIAAPEEVRRLVEQDFAAYYSSHPAGAFAAQVWTNNAWIAAVCLVSGILIAPVLGILLSNTLNLGVTAGLMAAANRLDLFFGLVLPHGLLELTAVFVAAGAGLKLGWTLVDPGGRPRGEAVAAQGRATAGMALGVGLVLAVSGLIEAFVTPSGLPTWARVSIGAAAEAAFLAYVVILGRRAVQGGEGGDVGSAAAGDRAPVAG